MSLLHFGGRVSETNDGAPLAISHLSFLRWRFAIFYLRPFLAHFALFVSKCLLKPPHTFIFFYFYQTNFHFFLLELLGRVARG